MGLSREEVELFYRLYYSLLAYANVKLNTVKGVSSPDDIEEIPLKETNKIRVELYKHPELIESFVAENPFDFSEEELKLVRSWKDFVKGRFIILRHLRNYTIFLDPDDPPKAYGVLALKTSFQEMFPYLPVMVEAVLLPFKDKIIYDSILRPYLIRFGGGIKRSLNDAYQKAKSMFGVITSLPFEEKARWSDADRLRFYLKSERNREMYSKEIERLIERDPALLRLYHQEMGKIHARSYGRKLREIGLREGWFAILEGIIIAGGETKDEVERVLKSILPAERRDFVYIFQLKGK
jgi:hypothetical protein